VTVMCKPFFAIPQAAMRLGKLRELGPVAFKLYIALWHDSERYSTRELRRTVAQLQALVGGSRNSHAKARAELVRVGLVVAEAYGAEGFVFHLCNPETGKPWLLDPREPAPYVRKGTSPAENPQAPARFKKPAKIENSGINFPFGRNDPNCPATAPGPEQTSPLLTWDEVGR
jgi:hypothetical protein